MSNLWHLHSPDWDALVALLDGVCRQKGLLTKSGRPNYGHLTRVYGVSDDTLHQWRARQLRPSRASIAKIAQYAGQPLGPWLVAAGLDAPEQE